MPLLLTKREYFDWIRSGTKTIDLRRGLARKGKVAVFMCGRETVRKRIAKAVEGPITGLVNEETYRRIVPDAPSLGGALERIRALYGNVEGTFVAYYLEPLPEKGFQSRAKVLARCTTTFFTEYVLPLTTKTLALG